MHTTNEILKAALTLPEDARLTLIEELSDSLREGACQDVWDSWATEAEDRIRAFERGEIEAIPGEQVMAELRARHSS